MKNRVGGQFYFFPCASRRPNEGPAHHSSKALNVQVVPYSVLGSESSNSENRAMRSSSAIFQSSVWLVGNWELWPIDLRSRNVSMAGNTAGTSSADLSVKLNQSLYKLAPMSVAMRSAGRVPIINGIRVRGGKRPNEHHVTSPRLTINHQAKAAISAVLAPGRYV